MNREQIRQNIEEKRQELEKKRKELTELDAQILLIRDDQRKKRELELKKEKLNNEIQVLEQQLIELENLEKHKVLQDSKDEREKLRDDIDSKWTYRLIYGTKMYTKLLSILGDESKVEQFAMDIDKVVRKFLDQELEGFSNAIKNSMSVGIQFAMMETLIEQGEQGAASFFTAFSKTDTDRGFGRTFEGLYQSFGKFGSANKFFILAKKVQNLVWYLSDKKSIIESSISPIPELVNPYQFKVLLTKDIWLDQSQIDKLDVTNVFTLHSQENINIYADEDKLRNIADNVLIEGVITEKTITAIQRSLQTADKLLDTRKNFTGTATDFVDMISGFLDINIPFLGNLSDLIGVEFPTDILGKKDQKKGGLISFILGGFGFRGGLRGLHRKYIQEKLDGLNIDNVFVSAVYNDFQNNITTSLTHDSPESIRKICGLSISDAALEAEIKDKIPVDYYALKHAIFTNINEYTTLHPAVVQKFAPHAVIQDSNRLIVDSSKITETDIDTYLQYIIPKLVADDFITSDKVNKDTFVLAVIGGLVGDKYFIEGVNIGLLTVDDFKNTSYTSVENSSWYSYQTIEEDDPELVKLANGPNENYTENEKFIQYLHTLEAKNTLPYGIMFNLMKVESGGRLYNSDGRTIIGSSAGAKGLFQFMPDTAKVYIVKLGYPVSEYEKIFTNPIIAAKACALFLKDCKDAGDDTISMLAHYNAGPNILSGAKITVQNFNTLPNETKKYILKIGYFMLEYVNTSPIITQEQIENPSLLDTATLSSFFSAVNAISSPKEISVESKEDLTEENYKANTMFIGDSLTIGYTNYPVENDNTKTIRGYRSLGNKMLGKTTDWMNQHFGEAINANPTPKTIILLGGVNDLCNFALANTTSTTKKTPQEMCDSIFANLLSMSKKAESAGITFIVGTILPFGKFLEKQQYASQKIIVYEALRLINHKIKTTRPTTHIDYYSVFNDIHNPGYLLPQYDGGDGIHLTIDGYKKMQELAFTKRKEVYSGTLSA